MADQRSGATLAEAAAVVGVPDEVLAEDEISAFVADRVASLRLDGRSVGQKLPATWVTHPWPGLAVAPRTCTTRDPISIMNSASWRRKQTVSGLKKSVAGDRDPEPLALTDDAHALEHACGEVHRILVP